MASFEASRGSSGRRASGAAAAISSSGRHRLRPDVREQEAADVPELRDEVAARRERLLEVVRVEDRCRRPGPCPRSPCSAARRRRTACTTSSGSMPLPSDLDILRCFVSRTVPCRYTVWNGAFAQERVPDHDHARHPEEQDLRRGDEHVASDRTRAGPSRLVGPAERARSARAMTRTTCRARPRPAAPGRRTVRASARGPRGSRSRCAAPVAVPHRDAMAPPELPRDVPVANALEPVDVHRFPALGQDADAFRRARP